MPNALERAYPERLIEKALIILGEQGQTNPTARLLFEGLSVAMGGHCKAYSHGDRSGATWDTMEAFIPLCTHIVDTASRR